MGCINHVVGETISFPSQSLPAEIGDYIRNEYIKPTTLKIKIFKERKFFSYILCGIMGYSIRVGMHRHQGVLCDRLASSFLNSKSSSSIAWVVIVQGFIRIVRMALWLQSWESQGISPPNLMQLGATICG